MLNNFEGYPFPIPLFTSYLHSMNAVAPLKILKASAGSGKTFSLTLHYITLLLTNENSYREILAVTFTNKATAEMKERILTVLHGLALGNSNPKIDDFRQLLIAQSSSWTAAQIQEKAYRIYRKILHNYGHFTISTIDGFSQKVIRAFTYELNLDAAYKIEMNTNKVKQDLSIMLNQLLDERPDLLTWIMDYADKKIANNENWNYRQQLLSLAGLIFTENFQEFNAHLTVAKPNELFHLLNKDIQGKTSIFLDTLSHSIAAFAQIFHGFQLTADELKGKSRNKLFAASKIHPKIHKKSSSDLQKIFDKYLQLPEDDDAFTLTDKSVREDIRQALAPILQQISELYTFFPTFIAYQAVQNNLYYLRLLKEMSDLLSLWRKENGAQLISDSQILLNRLGLDEQQDPTFIWEKIGNRYTYFLFDEFQDTSRIQWKNYSPLLINALGQAQQKISEHLIVGDVKQSIYRWRNGDWRILLQQVEEQVGQAFHLSPEERPNFIENGSLDVNFRSYPNIITLNNYLFSSIPKMLQEVLNDKVMDNLQAEAQQWWIASGNSEMLVKAYANSEQQIPSHRLENKGRQGAVEIQYLPVTDGRWRRNQVTDTALDLLCEKIGAWLSTGRYKARQIGILVRSNAQAKLVIQQLMIYKNMSGVNFEVISGDALSLASNDAILLLLETLKALVYSSDKHMIHRAKMAYLFQLIRNEGHFDSSYWLDFKSNDLQAIRAILPSALIDQWASLQQSPLVHLLEQLIEIFELHKEDNVHLPYILAFKDMISNFSTAGERGITQFLQYWEEDGHTASLPFNGKVDAIEVTTIHKSKGLAYDVVMIPFCSWDVDGKLNGDFWVDTQETPFQTLGKIPIKYNSSVGTSIFYKQYYEEMLFNYMDALNTFYVATTRAIQHLYILAPAFKDNVDKKTGEIIGEDMKSEYISDLLFQALSTSTAPFPLENKQLIIDPPITEAETLLAEKPGESVSAKTKEERIALSAYPVSHELQKAFEKSAKRSVNNILMLEKATQYGIFAHEILSEISKEEEVVPMIDRYIEEGILTPDDRPFLLEEIQRIWHHPQINQWLTGAFKTWNEASIILESGETIRPDKVFTSATETIVLDFKFTKGDYADHQWQVDSYKKALINLGYQNVRGYLYYAKFNELVEVT
ncbi:UvrD-helicase domain-containing protein [Sphingobacterium paludis]|uniref:DNA 3'-5' helicase n=1 Tax=Sphingobacterium paludis TaxID=1476465 RepID=A0A4R7D167_9SPHI|nr:UvrD-helicase domain-containing protein [Sphingobacterium paludis]TDS13982.1 ATP-dependent exoDNAse (exonuclease V) beta subunit [Sphingobacterium paludis]